MSTLNPRLDHLQPYPFQKLAQQLGTETPNPDLTPLRLSVGEPRHAPPTFLKDVMAESFDLLRRYPPTSGSSELKAAIASWANTRFKLADQLDPNAMVLPCNGTREALFAIVQALVGGRDDTPLVLMPNPFYQIYEGAAILAGAETGFINNRPDNQLPDFDSVTVDQWQKCQLLFICTPGNPSGISIPLEQLARLIELAHEHNFTIISDECYSELYLDEQAPVPGLLQAAAQSRYQDFSRCLAFHSLSKRSNLAGLRSGFVAGDPDLLEAFLLYRTYHGSAMSLQNQALSAAAWSDNQHVVENRQLYRHKYDVLCPMLDEHFDYQMPDAGFYLWLNTHSDDIDFATTLYRDQHLTVLPGSLLSRDTEQCNPGKGFIRLALVNPLDECQQAIERLIQHAQRYRT